jgi:hypothetical protein
MFGKIISVVLMSLLLIAGTVLAGGEKGNFGLGFSVTESTPTFSGIFWISNSLTLEPSFAFSTFSLDADHKATQLSPGFGISFHMCHGKDTRPFAGLRFMYNMLLSNSENYSDLYLGSAFGISQYLSNQFAVSGEYQINLISTDDYYSPSQLTPGATYVQSASFVRVHFYF